jgi:hypothetical protein
MASVAKAVATRLVAVYADRKKAEDRATTPSQEATSKIARRLIENNRGAGTYPHPIGRGCKS